MTKLVLLLACLSAKDLEVMRSNRQIAAQIGCEKTIVVPGRSIGSIYLGESASDAVRDAPDHVAFEIEGGKVVRVRHTAPSACISTGMLAPLRVVNATSDVPQIAGLAIARDREGVHVTVRAR